MREAEEEEGDEPGRLEEAAEEAPSTREEAFAAATRAAALLLACCCKAFCAAICALTALSALDENSTLSLTLPSLSMHNWAARSSAGTSWGCRCKHSRTAAKLSSARPPASKDRESRYQL